MVDAGMRVMRINFSHATFEEAEKRLTNLRAVSFYAWCGSDPCIVPVE